MFIEKGRFPIEQQKKMEEKNGKEKNPIKILSDWIDKMADGLKKKGLKEDAIIIEKIKERLNSYFEVLKKEKERLEGVWQRKVVSFQELKISNKIPVTHLIGEKGGKIYSPGESPKPWFGEKLTDKLKAEGREIINFDFTKEGKEEFYRLLGLFKKGGGEKAEHIPLIFQEKINKERREGGDDKIRIDFNNYEAIFPTKIKDINICIEERRRPADSKKERSISLELGPELMEKFFLRD